MGKKINEKLIKQIMADYSCSYNDVLDDKNHFTIYKLNDGYRKYEHIEECKLRLVIINSKLIFTGTEEIINCLKKKFNNVSGQWLLEPKNMGALSKTLKKFGQTVSMVHPYYVTDKKTKLSTKYTITKYNKDEIEQFRDDDRYDEAYAWQEGTPDVLGCSISIGNKIVGMAGASIDSPYMMQIGINVDKQYQGKGIATALVSSIKNDIIDMGYLAYYGTSFSHIASQKVALKSGLEISFVELFTMPIK